MNGRASSSKAQSMSCSSAGRAAELTGFKTTSITYPRYFFYLWLPFSIHLNITDSSRNDETNQTPFFPALEKVVVILFQHPPPSRLGQVAPEGLLGQHAAAEALWVSLVCLRWLRLGRAVHRRHVLARSQR